MFLSEARCTVVFLLLLTLSYCACVSFCVIKFTTFGLPVAILLFCIHDLTKKYQSATNKLKMNKVDTLTILSCKSKSLLIPSTS